jgi:hypothetical protein
MCYIQGNREVHINIAIIKMEEKSLLCQMLSCCLKWS